MLLERKKNETGNFLRMKLFKTFYAISCKKMTSTNKLIIEWPKENLFVLFIHTP